MPLLSLSGASSPGRPVSTLLLGLGVLALAVVVGDRLTGENGPRPPASDEPCDAGEPSCLGPEAEDPGPSGSPVISADRICLSAGYLCAGLDDGGEIRVVRWNEDTRRIRVRIPTPEGVEPDRTRLLQEAAARGIRAWHGRPFALRVDLSDRPGSHDFVVRWSRLLQGRELGRTSTHWVRQDGRADLEVREFALATHNPNDPNRELPSRQVELTAAHEMGHVLGLYHSDDPDDVMYPENTATRLTARDFTTLHALYQLENGAFIR